MATVSNLNRNLILGLIEGFSPIIAALGVHATVIKPGESALNDIVRVPYSQAATSSLSFTYAGGYTGNNGNVQGLPVTMGNILYQPIQLTDSELSVLDDKAVVAIGREAGAQLAADAIGNVYSSTVTAANFPNSGSLTATNFTSSNAITALDAAVNALKWPRGGSRALICGTSLWQNLLNNPNVIQANNYGDGQVIQEGVLKSIFGFTPYLTTVAMPNSDTGFAVNPSAILVGNGYHAPTDQGSQYIAAEQIVDDASGWTIGFRNWYNPTLATNIRIFDVLFGSAAGNTTALYHIK